MYADLPSGVSMPACAAHDQDAAGDGVDGHHCGGGEGSFSRKSEASAAVGGERDTAEPRRLRPKT